MNQIRTVPESGILSFLPNALVRTRVRLTNKPILGFSGPIKLQGCY